MIGLGVALATARCPAQTNGNFYPSGFSFANTSNVVATNASGSLAIAHGQGVTLFPTFATVAGANGSNVTMTVQASPDNTNWTTVGIAACTLANNGTNTVMGCVQLNATNLTNAYYYLNSYFSSTIENHVQPAPGRTLMVTAILDL